MFSQTETLMYLMRHTRWRKISGNTDLCIVQLCESKRVYGRMNAAVNNGREEEWLYARIIKYVTH